MVAENLVFQVGLVLPELSTLVQYLELGSIHPTANHWGFRNDDERWRPRAEIKQTSTLNLAMVEELNHRKQKTVGRDFDLNRRCRRQSFVSLLADEVIRYLPDEHLRRE